MSRGGRPAATAEQEQDRRADRRVLLATAGTLLLAFSIGAVVQTAVLYKPDDDSLPNLVGMMPELGVRLVVNFVAVGIVLALCALLRPEERRRGAQVAVVIGLGAIGALARRGIQDALGLYADPSWSVFVGDVGSTFLVAIVSLVLALAQVGARQRLRQQERARTEQEVRASTALAALAEEELRVRREVAEGLHGTVQQQLVLSQLQLDGVIERLERDAPDATDVARLRRVRDELDAIRERDVRELSQLLYPEGVSLGIAHAVRLLLGRMPATIATEAVIDERLGAADADDGLDIARRVALVRAAEEGVTNALRHGRAGRIRIVLAVDDEAPGTPSVRLEVHDDGRGMRGDARRSGLARTAERLSGLGGALELGGSELGGVRLRAVLPAP